MTGSRVEVDHSARSSDTDVAISACPASLRFKERGQHEATIIPACRARHGHRKTLYTSTDSELTIGEYNNSSNRLTVIDPLIQQFPEGPRAD